MIAATILALAAAVAHPNSLSSSRVLVDGDSVQVDLRCQVLSLEEVLGSLDTDADEFVSASEVAARAEEIGDYVLRHYRLSLPEGEKHIALAGQVSSVVLAPPSGQTFGGQDLVDIRFAFQASGRIDALVIDVTLFEEAGTEHVDLCQIVWNGLDPVPRTFDRRQRTVLFPPGVDRGGSTFLRFAGLGIEHILGGWDHLAFLLALLLGTRRPRSLLVVVTAFTAAHSVTLALASLGWISLPSRLVEIAIALSVAYVGADNLLHPERGARWVEAFVFGLVHGLGFAGFLGESLLFESARTTALIAFNLGVEVGQLAVVSVCCGALLWLRGFTGTGGAAFVPARLRVLGSLAVTGLGLFWFVQRAWFA